MSTQAWVTLPLGITNTIRRLAISGVQRVALVLAFAHGLDVDSTLPRAPCPQARGGGAVRVRTAVRSTGGDAGRGGVAWRRGSRRLRPRPRGTRTGADGMVRCRVAARLRD